MSGSDNYVKVSFNRRWDFSNKVIFTNGSAPSSFSFPALAPRANTRTRCLPAPFSNGCNYRICWSALRTSMLSRYATSSRCTKFCEISFARATASTLCFCAVDFFKQHAFVCFFSHLKFSCNVVISI